MSGLLEGYRVRRRKETEKAAVERRKRMYGCDGECVKEIYDTETQKRSMYPCGGIDTCDERRIREGIGTLISVLMIVLAPIAAIAAVVVIKIF
jgi:hypothetical protein